MTRRSLAIRLPTAAPRRRGFTLAELIVAGVIVALLAAATAGVIATLMRAQRSAGARREAFGRADAVASRMAQDLQQLVRDGELDHTRLLITDGGAEGAASDELLVLARSGRPMRSPDTGAESGEYLVHYRVQKAGARQEAWRRVNHANAVVEEGGGIATRLAEGVELLSVEASDGVDWFPVWDADIDGLPHGLRVSVRARAADGITVATARRVVAVDRVPIPKEEEEEEKSGGSTSGGGG